MEKVLSFPLKLECIRYNEQHECIFCTVECNDYHYISNVHSTYTLFLKTILNALKFKTKSSFLISVGPTLWHRWLLVIVKDFICLLTHIAVNMCALVCAVCFMLLPVLPNAKELVGHYYMRHYFFTQSVLQQGGQNWGVVSGGHLGQEVFCKWWIDYTFLPSSMLLCCCSNHWRISSKLTFIDVNLNI